MSSEESPLPQVSNRISIGGALVSMASWMLAHNLPILPHGHTLQSLNETAYRLADLYGQSCGACPLDLLGDLCIGNPDHVFTIDGRQYTHTLFYFYCRYATCSRHVDFTKLESYVEIGGGMAMQAEIVKRAHPHLNLFLFDLPTQTYFQAQYLKTAFGSDPKITCLPNWEIGNTQWGQPALLWNAASFGEMEPEIIAFYLDLMRGRFDFCYLFQLMSGKELSQGDGHGVQRQTRLADFDAMLAEHDLALLAKQPYFAGMSNYFKGMPGYEEAVWG